MLQKQCEETAHSHSAWRATVRKGVADAESAKAAEAETRRQRRHEHAHVLASPAGHVPTLWMNGGCIVFGDF